VLFFLQVFSPKIEYNGQILITLVNKNTPPKTSSTIDAGPSTILVINSIEKTTAKIILIVLSNDPMLDFIIVYFW